MAPLSDFRHAQRTLSRRWLGRHARREPRWSRPLTVADAVAGAASAVHAVGIGYRRVKGRFTKTRVVQVFVEQKLRESLLLRRDLVPKSVDGLPVDVVESKAAVATGGTRRRRLPTARASSGPSGSLVKALVATRPVRPGLSAAHSQVTFGTLGCFCRAADPSGDPSGVFALSANHVFAACNDAALGDDLLQPSFGDADGNPAEGHFSDLSAFEPLRFGGHLNNRIDAAAGRLRADVEFDPRIPLIGRPNDVGFAVQDQRVCKFGRTSEYTEGQVTNPFYDVNVTYQVSGGTRVASFDDQLRIEPTGIFSRWALPGDSGSLVAAMPTAGHTTGLGLHFSGADDGSYGVACQLMDVLDTLKLTLA